ncbi:hypothetical protein HR11_04895 [Porphyromonas macacae]|uniref:hypothetical protein n=1 Tax=Porphyromonas macacae TaxID=28115 RepID=UPI00052BE1B0|nr:hypothetical protein [Porphyromonas macacae]KGN99576.1 hypothetical protein HR11_04895 [Porphyromonas macacae]
MMNFNKILVFIGGLFLLLLTACSKDVPDFSDDSAPEGTPVMISFGGYADGISETLLRNDDKDLLGIKDLRMLVFDENRHFLYSRKPVLSGTLDMDNLLEADHLPDKKKGNIHKVRKFQVSLISSNKKRYIHFVANYDWQNFPQDYLLEGKDAGDIIAGLTTTGFVFWREIELNKIEDLKGKAVKLLRNHARISVELKSGGIQDFEYLGYKVYNTYDRGTVAPFNFNESSLTYEFPKNPDKPTIPANVQIKNIPSVFSKDFCDVFERFNSNSKEQSPLFVIVKGRFKNTESYYKIDLKKVSTDPKGVTTLYDIVRNCHYRIKINAVNSRGYSSPEKAAKEPAGNNLFASVNLAEFPAISDGTHKLSVSSLGGTFVGIKSGFPKTFEATVEYDGGYEKIKVYSDWKSNDRYMGECKFTKTGSNTGKITVEIKETPDDRELTYRVNIVAEGSDMSRQMVFTLRFPYKFEAKLNSKGADANSKVVISFNVPPRMPKTAVPFDVYVETKELTPDLSSNNGMLVVVREGKYFYRYTVKSDAELGKTIDLNFLRNENRKSETITLFSELYELQTVYLPAN